MVGCRDGARGRGKGRGAALPASTVTLPLTDIEGSTQSWDTAPSAMAQAMSQHYELSVKL
jgi:hypothetical protein